MSVIEIIKSNKIKLAVSSSLIAVALLVNAFLIPHNRVASFRDGQVVVTLTNDKCTLPNVLEAARPEIKDRLKQGLVEFKGEFAQTYGKQRALCYIEEGGRVFFMDQEGVTGQLLSESFK